VELRLDKTEVNEAGLPARGSEPAGSGEESGNPATKDSETNTGIIKFNAKDPLAAVTIGGETVVLDKPAGDPNQVINGAKGTLEITGVVYDPVTGDGTIVYRYTLKDNTAGDATTESFNVVVKEGDGDSRAATLTIDIVDDAPQARDDTDRVAAGSFLPATSTMPNASLSSIAPVSSTRTVWPRVGLNWRVTYPRLLGVVPDHASLPSTVMRSG